MWSRIVFLCFVITVSAQFHVREKLLGMPLDSEIRYRRDIDCFSPKNSGKGSTPTQKFYFDEKWQTCLAFKYNGEGGNNNRYNSIDECTQSCRHLDGSVCNSPSGSKAPISGAETQDCNKAKCPTGYSCRRGMFIECCHDAEMKEVDIAYSETCPDKSKASGINVDYFQAIFAKTCDDLICQPGQKCVQTSKNFAKCCGEKRLADDIPVSAGALHVRIDDCQLEERLALHECSKFLKTIDVARKISNSRLFTGSASILKEFAIACAKFEEYKTCVALVTKNAGCLDRSLAAKEQLLNFVCQENVRESMSKENSECINQLAKSPKIKECENALRKNLENANGDVCSALDQTLSCTKSALLSCGRNTLSYVTNIVTTIKANMDDCIFSSSEVSGSNENVESIVKTEVQLPSSLSITSVRPIPKRTSGISSKKSSNRLPSRIFPSLKARCSPLITIRASSTCFPLLSSRSVKQALTPRSGEFILTNFDTSNIVKFCDQSSRYRKCLEDLYSNDDACLANLKEDAFYSFIVAFEDKFCEQVKQIEWLINVGCLKETTDKLSVKRCLLNSGVDEDRAFCKVKQQMTDCVMDSIISNCRAPEVKFFERIYDGMHLRSSFCIPIEKPSLGTLISSKTEDDDEDSETKSVMKTAVFSNECLRARQLALIQEESYIPECRETGTFQPMQCDRYNGSCFCVDELTGIPFTGTASGPGHPLPLCGLKSLFTCEKLPSKIFCEVDGTIAQKTERWYRRGDHCALYLHDYCAQQSHIPPIPLRTKSDCQRFCLPPTR